MLCMGYARSDGRVGAVSVIEFFLDPHPGSLSRAFPPRKGEGYEPHAAWLIFSTFTPPPSKSITLLSSFTSA
jgi:hypothetical protein